MNKKVNKFVSFVISTSLLLQTANFNVFADGDDPTDSFIGAVKDHFKAGGREPDGSFRAITYPGDDVNGTRFALGNDPKKIDDIINPKYYKDYRLVKFYNIPALLAEDKEKYSKYHGSPTGNIPLKLMVDMYFNGMKESNEILHRLKDMGFEKKMINYSKEFNAKLKTDPNLKKNVSELAQRMGTKEEDAEYAYSIFITIECMARELAKNADEMDRITSRVKYGLDKILANRGVAYVSACAAGGVIGSVGTGIGMTIGTILFPGAGTVVGGLLGCAAVFVLNFGIGAATAHANLKAKERIEVADEKHKRCINGSIDASAARLRLERAINYALLLRQMMHFVNQETQKMMDSNVFVTAVDCRNFINTDALKRSKDYQSAVDLMATPNQGAWCDFKYIPGLENAPRAKDYCTKDGRSIKYLIDIFKSACAGGDKVNFDKLKLYADGRELPTSLKAISTSLQKTIARYKRFGASDEEIVDLVIDDDPSISREEILKMIKEETMALQTQSK